MKKEKEKNLFHKSKKRLDNILSKIIDALTIK